MKVGLGLNLLTVSLGELKIRCLDVGDPAPSSLGS